MDLVAEGVTDLPASGQEIGAEGDPLVVGLHNGQVGDPTLEASSTKLAPSGSTRSSITV